MPVRTLAGVVLLAALAGAVPARAQSDSLPPDGTHRIFRDSLLDQMVGAWAMRGTLRGQSVEYRAHADWVLNHQFLRLELHDVNSPPAYEALVFIGYDFSKDRYIAHWLDGYGGWASETLGLGQRRGQAIEFLFDYPNGLFSNTMTWDPERQGWSLALRAKDRGGNWQPFADYWMSRRAE
ncbi:MAG TPA: hypothetical protein VFO06_08835 [Gemmatimonadales bacterium]|nr:hypothetical protein [Gemmatimonadales bacterium]